MNENAREGKIQPTKIITEKKFRFLKQFESTLSEKDKKDIDAFLEHKKAEAKERYKKHIEMVRNPSNNAKKATPIESIPVKIMKRWYIEAFEMQNKRKLSFENEEQKVFLNAICRYFAKDKTLETESFDFISGNFDLNKGLLIAGGYGCGKTSMMNAFHYIGRWIYDKYNDTFMWFNPINCNEINVEFMEKDADKGSIMDKYSKAHRYFDDFGTEKHFYGDFVMREILENRYMNLNLKTYLTTNLSMSEIELKYSGRVSSRLAQQCNLVFMSGEDRRTKQC